LLQYLKTKFALYRALVRQVEDEPGLASFERKFDRVSPYNEKKLGPMFLNRLTDEIGLNVKAVEVRTVPGGWLRWLKNRPVSAAHTRSRWSPLPDVESGWTLHLIRAGETSSPLFQSQYIAQHKDIRELRAMIELQPEVLRGLRGLDVAGNERNGPLWLWVRALQDLRKMARRTASRQPSAGLHPLRLTLHVGEDFGHPATGLRTIHEPFVWRLMERGDRFGHALALGLDIPDWLSRRACRPTRWERLIDLGWMWFAIRRFNVPIDMQWLSVREEEAFTLAKFLFAVDRPGELWSDSPQRRFLDLLADGWQALGNPQLLTHLNYPEQGAEEPKGVMRWFDLEDEPRPATRPVVEMRWLFQYLYNEAIQSRAHEPLNVTPDPQEVTILTALQTALQGHLAQWQTIVELNPTSNMLIGDLQTPLNQPIYHLRPVDPDQQGVVPVTLSSDDPLTFATNLSDEFAYAWAGQVVAGGVPPAFARAWLEEAAATSMRARFTLPESQDEREV